MEAQLQDGTGPTDPDPPVASQQGQGVGVGGFSAGTLAPPTSLVCSSEGLQVSVEAGLSL